MSWSFSTFRPFCILKDDQLTSLVPSNPTEYCRKWYDGRIKWEAFAPMNTLWIHSVNLLCRCLPVDFKNALTKKSQSVSWEGLRSSSVTLYCCNESFLRKTPWASSCNGTLVTSHMCFGGGGRERTASMYQTFFTESNNVTAYSWLYGTLVHVRSMNCAIRYIPSNR